MNYLFAALAVIGAYLIGSINFAVIFTKKYNNVDTDMDDLISIGTIGLIKAVSTFKSDKGIRLATYAARCIDNEVLMYFRSIKRC